jgi:hypothetical protein
MRKLWCITVAMVLLSGWAFCPQGWAADWEMVGARAGISDNRNDKNFYQYEAFAIWNMPWSWNLGAGWSLTPYLEANAGLIRASRTSAFIGSAGPGIYFTGFKETTRIFMGINPTYISKHQFGRDDLGGAIQFTSHIGIDFHVTRQWAIGYRLQHMSNAGLYSPNPGVNIHMLEVGYRF